MLICVFVVPIWHKHVFCDLAQISTYFCSLSQLSSVVYSSLCTVFYTPLDTWRSFLSGLQFHAACPASLGENHAEITKPSPATLTFEPVKRICVFEHSVMTNFNCACPAIQRGQGSGFLSEGSSWLTACISEQRRLWQDCVDAQARLNLRCSHRR